MSKTFNIYCDESCHLENDHKPYMFLGMIKCPYNQVRFHSSRIREIKEKHNFYGEIKWSNVSQSKNKFHHELIDYFFSSDLRFRCLAIDKDKVKPQAFNATYDDFYYKMYYQLLNHNIDVFCHYNVYLDIKDTLSACKVNKLREILNVKYGVFQNIQNIRSEDSLLMQLTDMLMGAVSYYNNNIEKQNITKLQLIEKIKRNSKIDLNSTNYSPKLNIFFISLR